MVRNMSEQTNTELQTVETLFQEMVAHGEPKLISNFTPSNSSEQKALFLEGRIRNPNHQYNALDAIDFAAERQAIEEKEREILLHPGLDPKIAATYSEFAADWIKKNRLMEVAHLIKHTENPVEKDALKKEYRALNVEIYGEPDETRYRGMLAWKLAQIEAKNPEGPARAIYQELLDLVPHDSSVEIVKPYEPDEETKEFVQTLAQTINERFLGHMDEDKETYSAHEVAALFREIIETDFSDEESGINAAEGWRVDVEEATVITVKASEKRIVIPDNEKMRSREDVRSLIAHEIGTHMLLSVMGGETNVDPSGIGGPGYYDFEEGFGSIMGQAIKGKFEPVSADAYILAGAAYYDDRDFRDLFEIKWRLALLGKDNPDLSDEKIKKVKEAAYGSTVRIERGTDEDPWLKDTGYSNGEIAAWEYFKKIKGDDTRIALLFGGGRHNAPDPEAERIAYEARDIVNKDWEDEEIAA